MSTSSFKPSVLNESVSRRNFIAKAGVAAVAVPTILSSTGLLAGKTAKSKPSETLVKKLYESFSDEQKKAVCFDWDHIGVVGRRRNTQKVLLRSHVSNNWHITRPNIISKFFTKDQQEMIEAIFFGLYEDDWKKNIKKQLQDDAGGYGKKQNIAIFGKPGTGKFEFVMTGRHLTMRCDGNSSDHFAFGGPIFYGHAANGFNEKANHPGNVYWYQAKKANALYKMLDGKQRKQALKAFQPDESEVEFQKNQKEVPGILGSDLSQDQQAHLQKVLETLVEPFRAADRKEVAKCIQAQGGLNACRLSFYESSDIGKDGVWDNWRLEGPSFVWYFRGAPHVHAWVNIADSPNAKITTHG
ncbi:hypothetical protein MNBD_PLANCTO02-3125 [hydrothermal vent metagenome]|uniref:DUF3500 domain-containing protein n=1 Tax=hydrothermal vent metagenome TaxID=652676 RepID=A0A3B1DXG9_9ZZZZ